MQRHASQPGAAPEPDAAAAAHSAALRARILREIDSCGGWIPFRRYMELALYEPGLGYYAAAGGEALGAASDFVTAPELSPLFARCLGTQCAEVLAELGGGDVLEPGAGSGALAAGVLAELEQRGCLPVRYRILEPSATLQESQRRLLEQRVPHLLERVRWEGAWPEAFAGVVIANEVLDALPAEGFRRTADGVEQRGTARAGDEGLADAWAPAPQGLRAAVEHIETDLGRALPQGYRSELHPQLGGWFAGLAEHLERGAVIIVDYGYVRSEYYLDERSMGTLVCTRAHRAHDDPYDHPGLTDITAFVDFTAVTEAATAAGLELEGFSPQAHFLIGCGLEDIAAPGLAAADTRERLRTSQAIKQLTMPGQMGERFSAIGFSLGLERPLRGFSVNDLSRRL